eukprot:Nitzschia sp. Nitz4//scaffold57_size113557//16663//21714//NITZ4_003983-RA/size113557-snap-gene-0.45-mRNA-1//-1//CDS//3329554822//3169//frame0
MEEDDHCTPTHSIPHSMPLMEMTQDCVVEWNETTPTTTTSTEGMDLESSNEECGAMNREQELDVMFDILQKEGAYPSFAQGGPPDAVRPGTRSLASRRRRRQNRPTQPTRNPKRQHTVTSRTSMASSTCTRPNRTVRQGVNALPSVVLPQSSSRLTSFPSVSGVFDGLLEDLSSKENVRPSLSNAQKVLPTEAREKDVNVGKQESTTAAQAAEVSVKQSLEKAIVPTPSTNPSDLGSKAPTDNPINPAATSTQQSVVDQDIKMQAPDTANQRTSSDEFGDLDLGGFDMDHLDALLDAKSSSDALRIQEQSVVPSTSIAHPPPEATIVARKQELSYEDSASAVTTSNEHTSNRTILADEFGEFPDFDFDLLDSAVAQQTIQSKETSLEKETVHNVQDTTSDTGLRFIQFSRYKVLSVQEDQVNFRKTLSVAKWVEKMAREKQKLNRLHKDANVELCAGEASSESSFALSPNEYPECGKIQLRGQWYYSIIAAGDVIHVCSLEGQFKTDETALPLVLHTHPPVGSLQDDLVLIHHPDSLMTPTVVSETVSCPRRAVLRSRTGSTLLTNPSTLMGSLRHALFGVCMKEQNFELPFVQRHVHQIIRENAESLLGCGLSSSDAERQMLETMPILREFVKQHTTFAGVTTKSPSAEPSTHVLGHLGSDKGIHFATHATYSIEEPVVSPELALKGFVDAVLETSTKPAGPGRSEKKDSLMALELKTGHNQTSQHTHMGQLSLYILMLQGRYGIRPANMPPSLSSGLSSSMGGKPDPEGAASGGLLLYMNQNSANAVHVAPDINEIKTLLAQRNILAAEIERASQPRGVQLSYTDENGNPKERNPTVKLFPAPTAKLPQVQSSVHGCKRCYENHSCMLYANSEILDEDWAGVKRTHGELLSEYTGHLQPDDLEYFRKWDRLIDLEAHATVGTVATSWLTHPGSREQGSGDCMSGLIYDGAEPKPTGSGVFLRFRRSNSAGLVTSNQSNLNKGTHVVISTDGTPFERHSQQVYLSTQQERKKFRHHFGIIRGDFGSATGTKVLVSVDRGSLDRIRGMVSRYSRSTETEDSLELRFRLDKDTAAVGIGTLRQNLVSLFTADTARSSGDATARNITRLRRFPRLRDFVVRQKVPTFLPIDEDSIFQSIERDIPGCRSQELMRDFQKLNQDQRDAVLKSVSAKDYVLIQGMPGTGKTSTLGYIARLFAASGKRVLITSYTNSAVDHVMQKLASDGLDKLGADGLPYIVRVGPRHSCQDTLGLHASVLATRLEEKLGDKRMELSQSSIRQNNLPTAESLKRVVSAARIVGTTVLTVPRTPLLVNEHFDVVIVDEAGQTSQPAVLGALMAADSFILVGDHQQLPPLVSSEIAKAGGYGESLLSTLAEKHPSSVAALTCQYRMSEEICKLSSYLIYGGRLKCGSEAVRTQKLPLPHFPHNLPPTVTGTQRFWPWLKMAVDPENSVMFVDTDNIRRVQGDDEERTQSLEETLGSRVGGSVVNPSEVTLIRNIIHGLIACGLNESAIGVISPFRAQVHLLEEDATFAGWRKKGLEVSTIDRYQGRDKPVVILSFVRSNAGGKAGKLLQDKRRLNVALTRAKYKLIMVGSFSTLKSGSAPLRPLLGRLNSKGGHRLLLPENALDCYDIASNKP